MTSMKHLKKNTTILE